MRASVLGSVAVLAVTLGAGSALGSGLTIHRTQNAGVIRPVGGGASRLGSISPMLAASAPRGGDTSPDGGTPPVLYGGGPVMHAVTTHVIAWAPPGFAFPSGYVSKYEHYLADLSHDLGLSSNVSSVLAQYGDATGSAMTSLTNDAPISDTDGYPTSGCPLFGASVCLTESQVVSEVANQIAGYGLSNDTNQSYMLLLPPGVDTCADSSASECEAQYFCGYHTAFAIGSGDYTSFTLLPYPESTYSNVVPLGETCTDGLGPSTVSADVMALDGIGAHELIESATDPVPGLGYIDSTNNEVADECTDFYAPTSLAIGGGNYNQLMNGDQYLIQDMWSNQAASCVQGEANTATAQITAATTVATGSPFALSATLGHDGAAASSYAWSYSAAGGPAQLNVASGPSVQLTLPMVGTYTVWVTITDAAGGTVTGVTAITAAAPPTALFTWGPAHPTANGQVSFTSGGVAGAGSITGFAWDFGDGTTSTLGAPSHVYTAPGNYNVTLTVTQADGLTGSVQHAITVAVQPPTSAWLRQILLSGKQPRRAGLLARNGTTLTVSHATASGRIVITWYATVKHRRTVVARGSQAVTSGATAHVVVRLTGAGRRLLAKVTRSIRITIVSSYSWAGPKVTASRTLTIKR